MNRLAGAVSALALPLALLTGCTSNPVTAPATDPTAASTDAGSMSDDFRVQTGRFTVTYRLDAAVVASSSVGIDVPAGLLLSDAGRPAATAKRGAVLGRLVADPAVLRALEGRDTGTVAASRLAAMRSRQARVTAPVAGTFKATPTPRIAHEGLDLVADLSPLQALRYRGMAFSGSASVETILGQQQVRCVATWIAAHGANSQQVHCRLADSVETTAGIPGVLTLTGPNLASVIAVPLRYVGLDPSGRNYVVKLADTSGTTERKVVVGVTDGVRRIILSGVKDGDDLSVVVR